MFWSNQVYHPVWGPSYSKHLWQLFKFDQDTGDMLSTFPVYLQLTSLCLSNPSDAQTKTILNHDTIFSLINLFPFKVEITTHPNQASRCCLARTQCQLPWLMFHIWKSFRIIDTALLGIKRSTISYLQLSSLACSKKWLNHGKIVRLIEVTFYNSIAAKETFVQCIRMMDIVTPTIISFQTLIFVEHLPHPDVLFNASFANDNS